MLEVRADQAITKSFFSSRQPCAREGAVGLQHPGELSPSRGVSHGAEEGRELIPISTSSLSPLVQALLLCACTEVTRKCSFPGEPGLLETRRGKIFKSKQKAECVEANTTTSEKQQSKAYPSERSHFLSEYS